MHLGAFEGIWSDVTLFVILRANICEALKKKLAIASNKGKPAHTQKVNTAGKAVNTDSKIVPAQTSAVSPNSNPRIQKTTMADS